MNFSFPDLAELAIKNIAMNETKHNEKINEYIRLNRTEICD